MWILAALDSIRSSCSAACMQSCSTSLLETSRVVAMASNNVTADNLGRFRLANTPRIRDLLKEVAQHPATSQGVSDMCKQYLNSEQVPWKVVQRAYEHCRKHSDQAVVQESAANICEGSQLLFTSPPARQRSKQLEDRIAKLQHMVDQQEYAAMVADVTQHERQAAALQDDPFFPTTKLQMSFGIHVIVTMGTFFALGYYGGKFLTGSDAWAAMMGAVGLAAGLLLETTLLIMRTSMPTPIDQKYAHLLDKRWDTPQPGSAQTSQQLTRAAGRLQRDSRAGVGNDHAKEE